MNAKEIINKLPDWAKVTTLPANEWLEFGTVMSKIEEILNISANGAKQVKQLESLEKLIWMASKAYHEK